MSESEKKLVRILLSQAASDALSATGEGAFAIVHRAMRGVEEPETAGRWVISLAPVEWETATAACEILLGTKKATAIRKPKPNATVTHTRAKGTDENLIKPHIQNAENPHETER